MAKYIPKEPLVAEIERIKKEECPIDTYEGKIKLFYFERFLSFIKSLEIKEVDLEKEINTYISNNFFGSETVGFFTNRTKEEPNDQDIALCAKHFFELGLKAKDWKKERMEECPYRQVGCTMYEGEILECKGACSWVVDYPKLKELKAQKGE